MRNNVARLLYYCELINKATSHKRMSLTEKRQTPVDYLVLPENDANCAILIEI